MKTAEEFMKEFMEKLENGDFDNRDKADEEWVKKPHEQSLLSCEEKPIVISLTRRQAEVLNTLLSAEIMKLNLHYGEQRHTERQDTCYAIRDKLIEGGFKS